MCFCLWRHDLQILVGVFYWPLYDLLISNWHDNDACKHNGPLCLACVKEEETLLRFIGKCCAIRPVPRWYRVSRRRSLAQGKVPQLNLYTACKSLVDVSVTFVTSRVHRPNQTRPRRWVAQRGHSFVYEHSDFSKRKRYCGVLHFVPVVCCVHRVRCLTQNCLDREARSDMQAEAIIKVVMTGCWALIDDVSELMLSGAWENLNSFRIFDRYVWTRSVDAVWYRTDLRATCAVKW